MVITFQAGCLKSNNETENSDTFNLSEHKFVTVINKEKLKQIILERNGKPLFINVWATWCVPCVEEFPDLVKLYNVYSPEKIDFISLSVDYPEEIDSLILPFLKRFDAVFPAYVADDKDSEQIINLLNPLWSGALPASFIYDGEGIQRVFILGKKDYNYFTNSIDSILSVL